jgi:hypothetical protein
MKLTDTRRPMVPYSSRRSEKQQHRRPALNFIIDPSKDLDTERESRCPSNSVILLPSASSPVLMDDESSGKFGYKRQPPKSFPDSVGSRIPFMNRDAGKTGATGLHYQGR